MRNFLAFLGLNVLVLAAGAAGKQPITGADVLKIRNVASVAVAPDGSFAIYGVQSIQSEPAADPKAEPTYRYRTNLWRIDLNDANARPEQLTFGDRSDSSPAIRPDGRTLAFVRVDTAAGAGARPRPQVWLLPLRGPGEAQAVTKLENGATAPDGSQWRETVFDLMSTLVVGTALRSAGASRAATSPPPPLCPLPAFACSSMSW